MAAITRYTILGERCSGTNYLQNVMELNFELPLTWDYGFKHFFGFANYQDQESDNTLFIGIVRESFSWINSMYRKKFHLALHLRQNINSFLNNQFYSIYDEYSERSDFTEIQEDRHIYEGRRYRNIFESRSVKLQFLLNDMPKRVKHYIFIRYEDLRDDFVSTMERIKAKGLNYKPGIETPINSSTYKDTNVPFKINTDDIIEPRLIYNHSDFDAVTEEKAGFKVPSEIQFRDLNRYRILCNTPSDINEHLPTLSHYASKSTTILEAGVRSVVSTWAFINGLIKGKETKACFDENKCSLSTVETNKRIYSVDISKAPINIAKSTAKEYDIELTFIQIDILKYEVPENIDLTFIDTFHCYGQLKRELAKLAPITNRYIILHDTTIDAEKSEVIRQPWEYNINDLIRKLGWSRSELEIGLWPAVTEFLDNNNDWKLHRRFVYNNGLTILKRK